MSRRVLSTTESAWPTSRRKGPVATVLAPKSRQSFCRLLRSFSRPLDLALHKSGVVWSDRLQLSRPVHVDLQVRCLFCHPREQLSLSVIFPSPHWHVREQGALRVLLPSTDTESGPTAPARCITSQFL